MNFSFSLRFFSRPSYELVIAALMLFNKTLQCSVASNNILFLKNNCLLVLGIFNCGIQALICTCGIQFPDQGLNLGPLYSEHGFLATGPPGKFPTTFLSCVIQGLANLGHKKKSRQKKKKKGTLLPMLADLTFFPQHIGNTDRIDPMLNQKSKYQQISKI